MGRHPLVAHDLMHGRDAYWPARGPRRDEASRESRVGDHGWQHCEELDGAHHVSAPPPQLLGVISAA
jgi:hypothetical protein